MCSHRQDPTIKFIGEILESMHDEKLAMVSGEAQEGTSRKHVGHERPAIALPVLVQKTTADL
jgi:hypothetical protein